MKLLAFYSHYCDVLDTILLVNADVVYLPYVTYPRVRKDVEKYNSEEGIEELKKMIKWAEKRLKDEERRNKDERLAEENF